MKAMILAVQVIEMVQGAPQGLTRRLPAKVICEDRCIAAPFTLSPDNRSPVPASYAKCGKAPEAEGDRASEENMVAHAEDGDGHDHEQATKPHRSREEAGLAPVELPAEEALGEKGHKEGRSAYDADFGEHIEIHVVRMEDCGYTSAWDILGIRLTKSIKLPRFPFLYSANIVNLLRENFNLRNASSVKQVKKSVTPTLFIHGEADTFVPYEMLNKVYSAAACEKEMLSVPDAPHARSVCAHPELYWKAVTGFINKHI